MSARGRSLGQLLDEFGGTLPTTPDARETTGAAKERLLVSRHSRRGGSRVGRGWSPVLAPLVPYLASTAEVGGVFPFVTALGLPPTGVAIGADLLSGGCF